jgi:hypothetical protein
VTISLPDSEESSNSIYSEFADVVKAVKKFRAAKLPGNVERLIHDVAANPDVAAAVINKVTSELPACHNKLYRMSARRILIWASLIPLSYGVTLIVPAHVVAVVFWLITTVIVESYILSYLDWRSEYRDSYIANFLIRSLEFGLGYQSAMTDERFRDGLALMIQRTAIRYSILYRKSHSTRFFAAQVRRQAKTCRNDIISLIPGLVVAGQSEIAAINADLTRLLIRTQTGYWHETSDILRHGTPMPRRNAARIALASFIKDRAIQVAFITLTATVVAAGIALLVHVK